MEALSPEDILCKEYQVSRITIKKALEDLKKEGYIIRIKRKGTFVNFERDQPVGARFTYARKGIEPAAKERNENLKMGTKMLAFIVPDIEDAFISEIYQGIKEASTEDGYELATFSSDKNTEKEVQNIELLKESNIGGAIIFPYWGRFNALQILGLKKTNFPFVPIDRYFKDIKTDYVGVDNYKGAYQAVKHLIGLGHKKIAHIKGVDCTANEGRFEGYRGAVSHAGIPYNPLLVSEIQPFETEGSLRFEPDDTGGYKEALVLLSQKDKPTAIFAGNDYIALGCYKAIKEMELKVPDDISLAGFDDLKFSSHLEVPLTTVRQPKYEIGKKSCEILMKKIKGQRAKDKFEQVILPTELIIRESCGAKNTGRRAKAELQKVQDKVEITSSTL